MYVMLCYVTSMEPIHWLQYNQLLSMLCQLSLQAVVTVNSQFEKDTLIKTSEEHFCIFTKLHRSAVKDEDK